MENNFIESSLSSIDINKDSVEKKILSRFQYLNDQQQLHFYFSSYDFRTEEESMIKVWQDLLLFLFKNIFSTFGMRISEIKNYTIIGNHIPCGLNNIIQELRIRKKLITDSDICGQEFYVQYFPELFSENDTSSQGWGSYLMSGVSNIFKFGTDKLLCREDKEEEDEKKEVKRTDILGEDRYTIFPDNAIIFNYELFRKNCDELLRFLTEILLENDHEVIPKNEFIKEVNNVSNNNNGGRYNDIDLNYGSIYIDYCLIFLSKLKKICIFNIEDKGKKVEFLKVMINRNDSANDKDKTLASLILKSDSLHFKINDLDNKIQLCMNNARNCLSKGNKKYAKTFLIKKKQYEKYHQIYSNLQITLINQIMDIKNAENNVQVQDILKSCNDVFKKTGLDRDEFEELKEDLKEQKDFQNEISEGMKEFANYDEDVLDEELKKMESENENENIQDQSGGNLEFPMALNEPINPFSEEAQRLYK